MLACPTLLLAQQDSTLRRKDTIKVGNILIINRKGNEGSPSDPETRKQDGKGDSVRVGVKKIIINDDGVRIETDRTEDRKRLIINDDGIYVEKSTDGKKRRNISTNWFVFDIGYAGFIDNTDYASKEAQDFLRFQQGVPASAKDYAIRGTRISNFNLWLFMQRMNLIDHVLNLKYGLGWESSNYYYKTRISYEDGGDPYTFRDAVSFSKNKLRTDYVTVPFMLNLQTHPSRRNGGLQLSFGVGAGYLVGARQKQVSQERGRQIDRSDFNLQRWKLALMSEIGIGPVMLQGSWNLTPQHRYALEHVPYTVGLRFSVASNDLDPTTWCRKT